MRTEIVHAQPSGLSIAEKQLDPLSSRGLA